MKKTYIYLLAVAGLLTACDPAKDDISAPGSDLTSQQLADGFTFKQYSDETYTTETADGNYFTFFTSPSRVVRIYQTDADGAENVLFAGAANGSFKLVPKRGNPTSQTFYVETLNFDGSKIVAEKTVNVYVPSELTPEMRLLASDAYGYKVWTWDTDWRDDEGCYGNMGYAAGDGESFVNSGNGIWWGATPEVLAQDDQRINANNEPLNGEEDRNAYMEFYDDGSIKTYSAAGNVIREGKYSVEGWTGERNHPSADGSQPNWSYGTLKTTAKAILFPFQINGYKEGSANATPTEFEIMQLDANHLKLVYPITAASGTAGGWSEATWWAFKSVSDPEAALTNFDKKTWTWDVDWRDDEGCWGNMGYAAGDGESFVNSGNGIWWGATPETLAQDDQRINANDAPLNGEEDRNAYMIFDWKNGTIDTYNAAGERIRGGKYEIRDWQMGKRSKASADGSQANWSYGTLYTDAASILFPFQINGYKEGSANATPTEFEIMQMDADHMKLVYPITAATGTAGGWSEATWWAFKKK